MLRLVSHLLHVHLLIEGVVGAAQWVLRAGDGGKNFRVEVGPGQHELLLVELISRVVATRVSIGILVIVAGGFVTEFVGPL